MHQCDSTSPLHGEPGLPRTVATNGFFKGSALAVLDSELRILGWTWLINQPDQQVLQTGMNSNRRSTHRKRRNAAETPSASNSSNFVSTFAVASGAHGAFPPPWSAHAIDTRLFAFDGRHILATFVKSCHAHQPCHFGISQVHLTGQPTPRGGIANLRAWANPTIKSTSHWAQGRNQALFQAPPQQSLSPPPPSLATAATANVASTSRGSALYVMPWAGLVASFGVPEFRPRHITCAPWTLPKARNKRVMPWVRRQNRMSCGPMPAGSELDIPVLVSPSDRDAGAHHTFGPPTLLHNHTAQLLAGIAPGGPRRSLTTHLIVADFGAAKGEPGGERACKALLGVGHVHHTDGFLNRKKAGATASRPATGSSADAAPFMFGADYDHFFFTLAPNPPFQPLARSEDFCLGSQGGAASGDCERVQFVAGMVMERDPDRRNPRPEWPRAAGPSGKGGHAPHLLLSFGVNDCESRVARISLARTRQLLNPLSGDGVCM